MTKKKLMNFFLINSYTRTNILKLLLFLNVIIVNGQSQQVYQLPQIMPRSAAAQNFMRYGEIPVDFSTGVPKIEIPLYTIENKKIKLPISVSYHASGIKVSDVSSEVGIGWVLNAGGIVTRSMLDILDEGGNAVKTYSSAEQFLTAVPNIVYGNPNAGCLCYPGSHTMEMYLNTHCNNEDLMSDRYFYSLPNGSSGIFRYNYPTRDTLITLPYRPYKIERVNNGSDQFKITDDQGILYTFQRFQDSSYGSSEWFLKEIVSADQTEHIQLNYITLNGESTSMSINTLSTPQQFIGGQNCYPQGHDSYPTDYAAGTGGGTYRVALSSIESDDEIVTFSYADREDFQFLKKITEIKITSKRDADHIKKKIIFNQSYFGTIGYGYTETMNKRLKLNSLNVYGEDITNPQIHSFTYDESVMLPTYQSRSMDFWGYYNGSNNGTAIPENMLPTIYQGHGYGGNRKADNGYNAKACMLKEIKYPTGGKSVFEFERAYVDYLYNDGGGYIGGLRIAKITNYAKDNEVSEIKSYRYDNPNYNFIDKEFYGYIHRYIDNEGGLLISGNALVGCWEYYIRNIITSTPVIPHDLMPGMPIAYSKVYEYNGTINNNSGYIEYSYSVPNDLSYVGMLRERHPFQEDIGNYDPKLNRKVIKDVLGNKMSEEFYYYSDHFSKTYKTGINITRTLTDIAFNKNIDLSSSGCPNCVEDYVQSIKAQNTLALQKANLLDYSVKRVYDRLNSNQFITDSIHYSYNQHNLMVNEASTVNSLANNIVTYYKYPYDFSSIQPYQTMLSKNILTPVIEQIVRNNNKQIQKTQTSYKDWGNNIIEPEIVKGQMDVSAPLENRIRYLSYDNKANPLTVKKEDGNPLTYLWGYNKSLPIASVENSKYVSETINNDFYVLYSGLQVPPGNVNQELGTFTITEEKNYKIDRTYERYPENYSVMYQTSFENLNNSSGSVAFTDTTPASGNFHTYTSPSVHLKPGTYKVKLTNIGYNGYQGQIENNINFTIYNSVEASIPFHTSFEEETVNTSNTYALTGKVSHTGNYVLSLPSGSLGYDKVIVSYWGKSGASSPWQYVENMVTLGNVQNYLIGSNFAYIDEVRVYPVGALVTTYTYDPFHKGQTSIMKPNGQTEYYDYDAFGRLKEVYIMENNVKKVLKSTSYHYKP